ncbi:hypothetical protein [Acidisphaera sp. L21]|uniref:hypothetical protein n=1 Tax=Acidisphaera sp. L21 TaxID=1641851 RepID=UPI001C2018F2|nr:hypothetical protein [Acidisphaera sp. L21]
MAVNSTIGLYLAGEISPQVALSRLLLEGMDAAQIKLAVFAARPDPPTAAWQSLAALTAEQASTLDRLASEVGRTGSDHSNLGGIAGIAAFFDNAVRFSPRPG